MPARRRARATTASCLPLRAAIRSAQVRSSSDLAFPLMHVDANMIHGWPLPSAALTAVCSCGATYAITSNERPAASSYLRSRNVGYVVDVGSPAFVRALEDAVVAVMIEKASAVEHVEAMPRSRAWTWCSSVPPTTPRCASAWPRA
jgi:hypothetical protein